MTMFLWHSTPGAAGQKGSYLPKNVAEGNRIAL